MFPPIKGKPQYFFFSGGKGPKYLGGTTTNENTFSGFPETTQKKKYICTIYDTFSLFSLQIPPPPIFSLRFKPSLCSLCGSAQNLKREHC